MQLTLVGELISSHSHNLYYTTDVGFFAPQFFLTIPEHSMKDYIFMI